MYNAKNTAQEENQKMPFLSLVPPFSLLILVLLVKKLVNHQLNGFDSEITGLITGFRGPVMTTTMKMITALGSAPVIILLVMLVIYATYRLKKHFFYAGILLIAAIGGWLSEATLKSIFHRPRPSLSHLVMVSGYSFPSGHATISIIVYGFLGYLLSLYFHKNRYRRLNVSILTLVILLIGISRIYLGVHYPSDVLAGFATGGFWLVGCMLTTNYLRRNTRWKTKLETNRR